MKAQYGVLAVAAAATIAVVVPPTHAGCQADVNGDEFVNVLDLLDVLTDWGPCPGCPSDADGSGEVDVLDLLIVLSDWDKGCPELAGDSAGQFPYFQYVKAFNQGEGFEVALDTSRHTGVIGKTADIYVVAAKTPDQWQADNSLADVTGGYQTETFVAGTIQANTFSISGSAGLSADAGIGLGVPYDVVLDFNQNGTFEAGDYIDGLEEGEHGLYVVHDVTQPGPYTVTEITYTCPNWDGTPGYSGQNTFYPKEVSDMGELPLIVVSHGNGHQYIWYDHIGFHMASYGYIVMSHQNNTVPGVYTASTTTLEHTDAFIRELPNIQSGKLDGHVDTSRITWIGHSRGGEGVAIAYDRIYDGAWTPLYYDIEDIQLVSSIAPVDFLGPYQTNPHGVNYSLWTGASDADVNGGASCNLCQTYHLHDRAEEYRQSITLHGCGHGWFHNGGGNPWATGPCLIGEAAAHAIVKGYLLPLVKHYIEANVPAKDFLTRQWEDFKPIGAPTGDCIVVDMMYRDGSDAGNFMIDDYESETSTTVSSSGGVVSYTVTNVWEGENDDQNTSFTHMTSDEMNGNTLGGQADNFTHGVVFEWNSNSYYQLNIVAAERDLTSHEFLSFRASQATRHPNTIAELGDLTFTVRLMDGNGVSSTMNIGAFGGGCEEPYQRTGEGSGVGWHNEWETTRLRLKDFQNNGSGLDLSDIVNVRMMFGPAYGSDVGRLNLDTVEITKN